jgi:hypothetical protein
MMTDELYAERLALVAALAQVAESKGWRCCWWIDPELQGQAGKWPVLCIELPTGQVTWHIERFDFYSAGFERFPQLHHSVWDGHSTKEKLRRIRECDWRTA